VTLQEILDLINQQGPAGPYSGGASTAMSGGGGGGAASISPNALSSLGGGGGGGAGGMLGGLAGMFGGGGAKSGDTGDQVAGSVGSGLMSIPSPWTMIPGAILEMLSSFGVFDFGGVPHEAKTAALGSALTSSGNPLADIVGQFVNKGVGQGHVMSESGSSTFGNSVETLSTFLQALTGQQIPTISGSGFEHNPTFNPPGLGRSGTNFALPQGYQFMDPSKAPDAAKIIEKLVGMSAPGGTPPQGEWQKIVQDLIGKGDLTKYQGPLGAVGASPTSPGANPNISLPHPLAPSPAKSVQPPYPLQQAA
jgi:hypothetical protein